MTDPRPPPARVIPRRAPHIRLPRSLSFQTAAAGETVLADSEASTSGGSPPSHAKGKAVNGIVNGKALVNGAAAAAGALANGATVDLGQVDATSVLAIEENIDACGAGQLEACAIDR